MSGKFQYSIRCTSNRKYKSIYHEVHVLLVSVTACISSNVGFVRHINIKYQRCQSMIINLKHWLNSTNTKCVLKLGYFTIMSQTSLVIYLYIFVITWITFKIEPKFVYSDSHTQTNTYILKLTHTHAHILTIKYWHSNTRNHILKLKYWLSHTNTHILSSHTQTHVLQLAYKN